MRKINILIVVILLIGCTEDNSKFHSKYDYYLNTLARKEKTFEHLSDFIDVKHPEIPNRYSFVLPQAMDFWGYSEIALSYTLKDEEYAKIRSILISDNKHWVKLSEAAFKDIYINDKLMHALDSENAVIPQLENNIFYFQEVSYDDCEIFIIDYGRDFIFNSEFLSENQNTNQIEHGYCYGVLLDKETNQIIYWLVAW